MNVIDYYNRNTKRFLRFGTGKGEYAIHRQVWGDGVQSEGEALHFAEELIITRLRNRGVKCIIDMGCGVGGTMRYMMDRYPADYRGITISQVQAEIAEQVVGKGQVSVGDMTDPKAMDTLFADSAGPTAIVCIEAFLHLPKTNRWFSLLAQNAAAGDMLVIQDDFLIAGRQNNQKSDKLIADFSAGWKASNLLSIEDAISAAESAGFALLESTDLTPLLRERRIQRLSIAVLVAILRPLRLKSGWWDNFLGGNALQQCIRDKITSYRQLVFVKE